VEQAIQETDDAREQEQSEGMVVNAAGIVDKRVAILVDLLRDQTEGSDVDAEPEDEEGKEGGL